MEDIEIMEKCISGDLEYFGKLYDKYIDKIYKYIYLKTSSREVSEDLASETFLSALNNVKSFKIYDNCSVQAWIYKIASNKIIDYYRTNKKTEEIGDYLEMSIKENFGEKVDNKERLKEVFNYLKDFKENHKEVFILRVWDDLSYKEISEITGNSVDNCKKIVSRTIKSINANFVVLILLLIII